MNNKVMTFVQFARQPDGISLTLRAPEEGEEDVSYQELVRHLEGLGFPSLDYGAVKHSYKRDRGKPVVICTEGVETFKVEVSSDEMAAHLILYDWDGDSHEVVKNSVFKALEEKGVKFGLKRDGVEQALAEGLKFARICVAEGRKPTEGSGATVHHPLRPPDLDVPEGQEINSMRVWSEPFIVVVDQGTVVAEKRWEGAEGEEGMTVTGRSIATLRGDDIDLHGENTEVSGDGNALTASIKGQLLVQREGADVGPLRDIKGDLDGTGDSVKFDGSVIVRGSVANGTMIRASGDVEVWGPVSSATIIAGRNIVLRSEVEGMNETVIRAGGKITAVSVESAEIAAKDSIFVSEALVECRVGARRRVLLGQEGELVGGMVVAGELLQVAHLGNSDGAHTQVKVATPDLLQKWHEIWREELAKEMAPLLEKRNKLEHGIGALKRRKERRGGRLEPQNEQLLHKMEQDLESVESRYQEFEQRMKKLPSREQFAQAGKIRVREKLHPGVVMNLGTTNFVPRDEHEAQRLLEGPDGITVEWLESCLATF